MEKGERAKPDSREWEEIFYDRYVPVARAVAARILYPSGTKEDIEEIAQDVMCEIIMNYEKFDESRGSLETYVRVMARSRALNYRKRQPRYHLVPLEGELELSTEDEDMAELKELVGEVIERLKPKEKILFTYRFLYHLTPKEIAEKTGCSRRAVDSRLTRLKKKLVRYFQDNGIAVKGGEGR